MTPNKRRRRRSSERIERQDSSNKNKKRINCAPANILQDVSENTRREPPAKKQKNASTNKKTTNRDCSSSAITSPFLKGYNRSSSLWQLVTTGEDLKDDDAFAAPRRKKNPGVPLVVKEEEEEATVLLRLPEELHPFIPQMIEFYLLMLERQLIQQGKKTNNKVLQTYHWCNNYRELDRGTAYFRSQILDLKDTLLNDKDGGNKCLTKAKYILQVLAMSYYYRHCNKIESFVNSPSGKIMRFGQCNKEFVQYVRDTVAQKKNFFTAAHINQGGERYIQYCQDTEAVRKVANDIANIEDGYNNMDKVCKTLQQGLKGVGRFMSWQIACDLEESCCFGPKLVEQLVPEPKEEQKEGPEDLLSAAAAVTGSNNKPMWVQKAYDDNFCELGPGAIGGLKCIFGETNVKRFDKLDLVKYVRDNLDYCLGLVGKKFPLWRNQKISLKVIEHALCEFQKFKKLDKDQGNGRRYRSRSPLLDKMVCSLPGCCSSNDAGRVDPLLLTRCDTCHVTACGGGSKCTNILFHHFGNDQNGNKWNCCKRCYDLEKLILL